MKNQQNNTPYKGFSKWKKALSLSPLVLATLVLSPMTYAQVATPTCHQAQQSDYQALMLATSINKQELVKKLLSTYCYNFDYYAQNNLVPPFFLAHDTNILKLFQDKKWDIVGYQDKLTGLDYLSSLLVEPINTTNPSAKEQSEFLSILQKYDPSVNLKMLNNSQNISLEERKSLLEYVATLYKDSYTQKKDMFNNTALSYVILTAEDGLVTQTMGSSSTLPLFRKNKEGFAPIHLVFNAHYLGSTNDKIKKQHLEKLNDEILATLDSSKVRLLTFRDMSFFEFAEMMKDGNPDFYNKLKTKFNFVVRDNPKNYEEYKKFAKENMRYPERVKKVLDDK